MRVRTVPLSKLAKLRSSSLSSSSLSIIFSRFEVMQKFEPKLTQLSFDFFLINEKGKNLRRKDLLYEAILIESYTDLNLFDFYSQIYVDSMREVKMFQRRSCVLFGPEG